MPAKRALIFIFITVLLNSIGFGIILPVMPSLIVDITGEALHEAARIGGYLAFVYAFMQFFTAPIVGNLSDRFGRRPVLLVSLSIFAIDYLIMGFAPTIAWLFVGRIIAGMTATSFGIANAYIADLFPPEERAQNFGLMGAAFGAGFILGPVIGGFLGDFGPRVPFFATAAIGILNVVFGFFVLPESLDKAKRRPFEVGRANPLGALRELSKYPLVVALLAAVFLYNFAHDSLPAVWSFYVIERYDWTPRDVGFSLGAVGICMMFVQGVVIRPVIPRFGAERVAIFGLLVSAVSFFGYAFASSGWMIYLWIVIGAGAGLIGPAVNSIMSAQIPANAQGELQGAIGSVTSLTYVLSPPVMTQLFAYFSSPSAPVYFPGAAYFLAGVVVLMGLAVFVRTIRRRIAAAA